MSVVITSKDRAQLLASLLTSLQAQTLQPSEVLVWDDGSSDGTRQMIASRFPFVRYIRSDRPLGIVAARNAAISAAAHELVATIDDDCVFVSPRTLEQLIGQFNIHGDVAVLTIPSVDIYISSRIIAGAPDDRDWATLHFRGGVNVMRRSVFIQLGGYRSAYFRQGEELDFATRLYEAGWIVQLGSADPMHHLITAARNHKEVLRYNARNSLLYAWFNLPLAILPFQTAATTVNWLVVGLREGESTAIIAGLLESFRVLFTHWRERSPVSVRTYFLIRSLRYSGPVDADSIAKTRRRSRQSTVGSARG